MHTVIRKSALAATVALLATQAHADITFYELPNFGGRAFTTAEALRNFERIEFNDRTSSVVVTGRPWEVCEDRGFGGRCLVLRAGSYASLRDTGLENRISSAREVGDSQRVPDDRWGPPPHRAQVTFYEHPNFTGNAVTLDDDAPNFRSIGFNDRASSVVVQGQPWEACEDNNFGGRCVMLRPGRYPDLAATGLQDRLSSARRVAYQPSPQPVRDWRRRPQERVYEVPVTAVRAVYAAPQQHCWIERERVVAPQESRPNVGGAVLGGIIGGILGHQVGGGTGRDVATGVGVVAGAAIGANAGRDRGDGTSVQDVRRCSAAPTQGQPDYWDVSYSFRGVEHHVQATTPPGATITVSETGEPRI